jgi:phosphoglycerate kinase
MNKKSIKDVKLANKSIIMRVDFNVPLDDGLNITDDTRIRAAIPSIKYILDNGAKKLQITRALQDREGILNETPVREW